MGLGSGDSRPEFPTHLNRQLFDVCEGELPRNVVALAFRDDGEDLAGVIAWHSPEKHLYRYLIVPPAGTDPRDLCKFSPSAYLGIPNAPVSKNF